MNPSKALILAAATLVMFSGRASAQSQIYQWVTIAGKAGAAGSADGTNSAIRFKGPQGVALDRGGNLYVGDSMNAAIRKLTLDGTNWVSSTIAGKAGSPGTADGTNSAARFAGDGSMGALAVDGDGNIFVPDFSNSTVRKVAPVGTNWVTSTIAGKAGSPGTADGTNSAARFNGPNAIALDSGGNLYVVESNNATIRKLTPVGTNWVSSTIAGKAGLTGSADGTNSAVRFNGPNALALDSGGNLYVSEYYNNTERELTPEGTNWVSSTIAGLAGHPGSTDGTNSAARFNHPYGVTVDSGGNLFVVDYGDATIRKLAPHGTNWVSSTIAGLAGHPGTADGTNSAARFNEPSCVALDSRGNVYVSDFSNNTIRKGVPLPVFQSVTQTNDQIAFIWSATAGQKLQLQYNSDLTSTTWINLGNTMTATNGTMSATDTIATDRERFYRVTIIP